MKWTIILVVLLFSSLFLLITSYCDIDWMMVSYKYQLGQATAAANHWEFCPFLIMEWWLAYQFTLFRFFLGAFFLGVFIILLVLSPILEKDC